MISHALHVDDGSIRLQDTCHLDLLLSEITSLGKAIDRGKGTHRKGTTGVSFEARIRRAKAVGLGEEVSVGPHRLSDLPPWNVPISRVRMWDTQGG